MEPARLNKSSCAESGQINDHDNQQSRALSDHAHDLPELVDLALITNPKTRSEWYSAQAADAQLGQSQADKYPQIAADAENGYLKLPYNFPDKHW